MKIKIISLIIASLFVSNSVLAADKSWTGLKIGVGIGGLNAQSKDKTTSSHSFEDSGNYTTPNFSSPSGDVPTNNLGSNAHENLRNLTNPQLDATAGLGTDEAGTSLVDSQTGGSPPPGFFEGTNVYNRNYQISETFVGSGFSSNDLSGSNIFGTIEAGYDWQLSEKVVFGLTASANFSSKNKASGTGAGENSSGWTESYTYTTLQNTSGLTCSGGNEECGSLGTGSTTPTYDSNLQTVNNPYGNNASGSSNIGVNSSVETGNSFDLGARIGFLANNDTLIFLSGGASAIKAKQNMTYSSSSNIDGTSALGDGLGDNSYNFSRSTSKSDTRFGYYVGAGLETRLTENATMKLEYRYADYGKMTSRSSRNEILSDGVGSNNLEFYDSIDGNSSLKHESDITVHSIRAVLSYNF